MAKITPKTMAVIIDEAVIESLPKNHEIKHGVGIALRDSDPEYHQRRNEKLHRVYASTEWRSNVDRANKTKHSDPEYRKAYLASYTPEANARRSASSRASWQDPELRARQSENSARAWENPQRRQAVEKPVMIDDKIFHSAASAAEFLGITRGAFSNLIKRRIGQARPGWRWLTQEEYQASLK